MPAAVGLLMLLLHAAYGTPEQPLLPLYSATLLLWAPWVQQNWTRQEHRLAARWATADFEEEEPHRHEFRGERHRGFYFGSSNTATTTTTTAAAAAAATTT